MATASNLSSRGEFLWDFWYPAARGGELLRREPRTAQILGLSLVLGRDSAGRVFAMDDHCPHRGMPLSFGQFEGCEVTCGYHGWKFDVHSGQCREIPSLAADANVKVDRIFARSYPCEEKDGYVWVFLSDKTQPQRPCPDAPSVPSLPVFGENYRTLFHSVLLPVDVDQGILGLIDPAHGPFVHESWFWRSRHTQREKEKTFEPIPNGFRMRAHPPSANTLVYKLLGVYNQPVTTTIDFVLPNLRLETIQCGPHWFTDRTMVTPIRENLCRMDFCAAWNLFRWVPFVETIFRPFARRFIAQDQKNFERQSIGLRTDPPLTLVGDADRQARWYFDLKAAWRESRESNAPMRHPLDGPVTLRWRS